MPSYRPTNFPYIAHQDDDQVSAPVGGQVIRLTAAAALKLGDAVYLSAAKTVNKSATVGDHAKTVGIVVGGTNTDFNVETGSGAYNSVTAADANEQVLVLVNGICYVIVDGAISAGAIIKPSVTVAGKVTTGAQLTIASGAVAVTSTAANGAIINGEGMNRSLGMLLEASTADAQIKLALIYRF